MQFIVRALDHKNALDRRLKVRQAHIDYIDRLKAEGRALMGVALLDDAGNMCGSMILFDVPSRTDIDAYLKDEPYVTGEVWEKIEVTPCKVGPSFLKG